MVENSCAVRNDDEIAAAGSHLLGHPDAVAAGC